MDNLDCDLNSNLKQEVNLNLKQFVDKFVVKVVNILFIVNKQYYSLCVKLNIIEKLFFCFHHFYFLNLICF